MASLPTGILRVSEMGFVTLTPGKWPPIPGFAPWPIFMTTACPVDRVSMSTPNLAEAHCTVTREQWATSFCTPPSPVPARIPVSSAALAIAMFGIPDRAPKDMSPKYSGAERCKGEPRAKGTMVFTDDARDSLDPSSRVFRYSLSRTREVLSISGRNSSLGSMARLGQLADVANFPLCPKLPRPLDGNRHIGRELGSFSPRRDASDVTYFVPDLGYTLLIKKIL